MSHPSADAAYSLALNLAKSRSAPLVWLISVMGLFNTTLALVCATRISMPNTDPEKETCAS